MAMPSLERAISWFEQNFDEVTETTLPAPRAFVLVDWRLKLEGELVDWSSPDDLSDTVAEWLKSALSLWELRGRPKKLCWRTRPRWEDRHIYSRFSM